jgi:hypothetical protein
MTGKRLLSLLGFVILVAALLGGGIYLRNFILRQVQKRIQSTFSYARIHLRLVPPSVVFDDVRTVSSSPFLSAQRVSVGLPLASLFKNEKPLAVFIDRPVVRITEGQKGASRKSIPSLSLPFVIEKGLIRGGEVYYSGRSVGLQAKGVRASMTMRGDSISLRMEAADSSLWLDPGRPPLSGKVRLLAEGRGNQLFVNKFVLDGPVAVVKAKGKLVGLFDPQGTLQVSFRADMKTLADFLQIPFIWAGRVEGEGELARTPEKITFTTGFVSNTLVLNHVPLENVNGRLGFSPPRGVSVDMNILRRTGPESVKITYSSGKVSGELKGFHLDPIFSYAAIPWPVRTPVWGKFELDEKQLKSDFEFRDADLSGPSEDGYPFRGPVRFTWDRKDEFTFLSPQLETSFGRLEVNGKIIANQSVDVLIKGDVSNVKAARELTSSVLPQPLIFPEIRGSGAATVRINGAFSSPRVQIDFTLAPAGFDRFDVEAAEGSVDVQENAVHGRFWVNDPFFKGTIQLLSGPQGLDAGIGLTEGDLQRILPGLDIQLPLQGQIGGSFQVRQTDQTINVDGQFTSPLVKFSGQDLRAVSGKLNWDGDIFSFPELEFQIYGGQVKGSSRLGIQSRFVELDLAGENIDLSTLSPEWTGKLALHVKGQGPMGSEVASGTFGIKGLTYGILLPADAQGDLRLRVSDTTIGVNAKGSLLPGENDIAVDGDIPVVGNELSVNVKGSFTNFDLLVPWKGVTGKLNYLAEIRGDPASPQINGVVDFQGPLLPFPQFSQAVTDYSGLIFIQNDNLSVRSFKGKLGGGDVQGGGEIVLGKNGVEKINGSMEGKNLVLSPLERTRALADASLRLTKDADRFVLDGTINVRRVLWRREVYEKFAFSSTPYPTTQTTPGFFDDLTLNLRLRAEDNAWMENSLGRLRGRFDLTVTGSIKDPIVLGNIESLGGEAYFQDRKFQILRGRVSFFNPSIIEPYLDFRGETYVKDYRITIRLTGLPTALKPEFSSSPPLPPEDVLALLALGEAFRRPYSAETSSQMSTTSLLSFTLTEQAQKRAEKLFSLDRFRIDPFLMGSSAEMTARLTMGKKISKNFFIYYSTNLTRGSAQEIIRLEWDFRNELSFVGTRNEIGRLSFDVKIRRRF